MSHTPLPPSPRRARLEATLSSAFELSIAFAGVLAALQFLFYPEVRALTAGGTINTTFSWTWTMLYLLGSTGILIGLLKLDDRIEIAGLILFAVAVLVNGTTILQVRGWQSGGAYAALQYLALAVASIVRIRNLLKLRQKLRPAGV